MTKQFSTDSPSIDEIMRRKKPMKKSVDIPLDPDVAQLLADKEDEIEKAEQALNRERTKASTAREMGRSLADGSQIQDLAKKIEDLEREYDELWESGKESIVTFWFQDIGKKAYDDLVNEHPPTDEQVKNWKDEGGEGRLAYNTETFPVALLAAASHEPKITPEKAQQIFDEWGNWEVIRLYRTAEAACMGATTVPKSRRSLTDTVETQTSD